MIARLSGYVTRPIPPEEPETLPAVVEVGSWVCSPRVSVDLQKAIERLSPGS